ncbi:MAG: quinone-dependent dihydroorotate dehydrogenase [Acidobacteriaceae bacterium]
MPKTDFPIKTILINAAYKKILKPLAFKLDAEYVHDRFTGVGKTLGKSKIGKNLTHWLFDYEHPALNQKILGIKFRNPVGLAAGFDKNGFLTDILPEVGFGFAELGSVTGEPCEGNPKPRLWRLKQSGSLVVYYGLKNDGCEAISKRLKGRQFKIPIGISIAKTNSPKTAERSAAIEDYVKAFSVFTDIADYLTVNISCPNAFGGQPFTDAESLDQLLARVDAIPYQKPIFLKLSPDLSDLQIDQIISVSEKHRVNGFICSNLTKNRNNPLIKESVPGMGGISGKALDRLSDELIRKVYQKSRGKFVIIGCGGIFTAEDAYRKIRLGSSLVQLITGMIFEGPQAIGNINRGLVRLLKRDGFANVSEAVGVDNKYY